MAKKKIGKNYRERKISKEARARIAKNTMSYNALFVRIKEYNEEWKAVDRIIERMGVADFIRKVIDDKLGPKDTIQRDSVQRRNKSTGKYAKAVKRVRSSRTNINRVFR